MDTQESRHTGGSALEPSVTVQVSTPDGTPLVDTTVVCIDGSTNAVLRGRTLEGGTKRLRTNEEGLFQLPIDGANVALVIANQVGFCLVQTRDLVMEPRMTVRPWGRIEGLRLNLGQPVAGQSLRLTLAGRFLVDRELGSVLSVRDKKDVTDSEGHFTFDHVPPVDVLISGMQHHPEVAYGALQFVEVQPGETTRTRIETHGRTIKGHLELDPAAATRAGASVVYEGLQPDLDLHAATELPSVPEEFDTQGKRALWWREWYKTEAGRRRLDLYSRLYGIEVLADGSFIADFIEPGEYVLTGTIMQDGEVVGRLSEPVKIPAAGPDSGEEPYDVGRVSPRILSRLSAGDPAPDFSVRTFDGQTVSLMDFRGRFLLLDFWATWCGPCITELPDLKGTWDRFGNNPRFAMLGLSVDSDLELPKRFVVAHTLEWTQGFLGHTSISSETSPYTTFGVPAILLIGPDGRVTAADLRGPRITEAVADALDQ